LNFIAAWKGCAEEAEKHGDTCLHIGEDGSSQARLQDRAIGNALKAGIDGLAISVINSEWLSQNAMQIAADKNIPIITFDSDLAAKYAHLRSSYIGIDNLEVGRELGRIAKNLRPEGGRVWFMSGNRHTENLNKRLVGARQILSGNRHFPEGKKLKGEGGWTEHIRSPWYCDDDYVRAINQIKTSINDSSFNVFISVGHWPIIRDDLYREAMAPIKAEPLVPDKKIFIVTVGELLPEQEKLLHEKLVHAYVKLDFKEMGRLAYLYLKALAVGKNVPSTAETTTRSLLWDGATKNTTPATGDK
jgi:ribose transport system substrate-binding protein